MVDEDDMELDKEEMEKERMLALVPASKLKENVGKLTYFFEPEFIEECRVAYQIRMKELSKMNLPFWK